MRPNNLEPVVFVGDLQSKLELLPVIIRQPEHLVFVGDILDSYGSDPRDHIRALDTILDLVEQGRATLLPGNHELSYLYPHMRASGWREETSHAMNARRARYLSAISNYRFWPERNVLATHAGLTKYWVGWPTVNESWLHMESKDLRGWWYTSGFYRNGTSPVGGPLWCDFYEEFESVPGLHQVFGHTPLHNKTPKHVSLYFSGKAIRRTTNGDWCIDALRDAPEVLFWNPGPNVWSIRTLEA